MKKSNLYLSNVNMQFYSTEIKGFYILNFHDSKSSELKASLSPKFRMIKFYQK